MYIVKIPVYIEVGVKNPKKIFLSLNWYRNCHFHTSNKVKEMVEDIIREQLIEQKAKPLHLYHITYAYNYRSKTSDLPNVCALASKYLNDAMKSLSLIEDDNIQYLKSENYFVGFEDKNDPHITAIISEHYESNHIDSNNLE